jgi:hypothetical protein
MLRSLIRLSLGVCVSLALAAACGSEDSKKHARRDGDAGAGGVPSEVDSGGSMSFAGQVPAPDAGSGGAGLIATGGQGGETLLPSAGAGGDFSVGGSGGEAGQGACCQPLTCADVAFECGYTGDGCGDYVVCDCPAGESCGGVVCVACVPDVEPCMLDPYLCGDAVDNCGNPITCPDTCSSQSSDLVCMDGHCRSCKSTCAFGDCGVVSDNCGGTLDCSGVGCENGTCQPNGICCTENADVCLDIECGEKWDNCKYVTCGGPCLDTEACVQNVCEESACKPLGYECGSTFNVAIDTYESCGICQAGETCIDNLCLPICH